MGRSSLFEHDAQLAMERLQAGDFFTKSLGEMNLPGLRRAPNGNRPSVPYVLFGEPDAPNVILQSAPYLTHVSSERHKVRLAAQKAVLGDKYAVVGVQAYDAVDGHYNLKDQLALVQGDFAPLSARMFRVAKALKLKDHQRVLPYGYFLGGDVAVQTAHDAIFNECRGDIKVEAVAAFKFARATKRGIIAVTKAMADSGKDLFANVYASESKALDEAWGIDRGLTVAANKKALNRRVNRGAVKYMAHGALNNLLLVNGFGTDRSVQQIEEIALPGDKAYVLIGRQDCSTVCPEAIDERLSLAQQIGSLEVLVENGDHSADDNIRKSAGRILYFANQVEASFN